LREPRDPVERIGISRTWEAVAQADLVLWISDATREKTHIAVATDTADLPRDMPRLHVINKIDLVGKKPCVLASGSGPEIFVSATTGAGLDLLKTALLEAVGWNAAAEGVFTARERHLQALHAAAEHLQAASTERGLELIAEELRLAQRALGTITGEVTADDLLGEIFSRFCIGK
jgi:tRNA modification GTPase